MVYPRIPVSKAIIWIPLILILAIAAACGGAAATPIVVEKEVVKEITKEVVVEKEVIKEVPVEVIVEKEVIKEVIKEVVATPVSAAMSSGELMKPAGSINYGVKETGIFEGHPRFISSPRVQYSAVTFGESMFAIQKDLSPGPMLATEWSISDDFLTWTIRIREDVEFHKGYGKMTMEDVFYTYKNYHEGALLARAGIIGDFWLGNDGGSQEFVDDYTIKLDTGTPWVPARAYEMMRHLGGVSTSVVSKKQSDELTPEVASKDIAATGPWEIKEHSSGEFWRFEAVENHWRQTPYFQELTLWSIPEEAARVAGFQTGKLDIFEMSFDSLPTVEAVEGAKIVAWPNAGQAGLNIYGQTYGTDKDGNPYKHLDSNNAWISADPDPESEEWARAVKVKRAMAISIDREVIVDTLLSGFGKPLFMRDWMGHEAKADPRWTFPFDPDAARVLLAEAGYPDGFSITLTPAIRGAPAEVEACEAVAQYWEDIGIDVKIQKVPYATIRPELITRKYQGVTCHTVSQRLTPVIGASNYVKKSTFSYGTEHPWMEEHITDALSEVDPVKLAQKEKEVYGWMYDNVMSFALYAHDGIWPVGPALDPEWTPFGFSEVRSPSGFEYIKHR